jgi:hypothetical protein
MLHPIQFQLVFHVVQGILLVLIQEDGHCKHIAVSRNVSSAVACLTDDFWVPPAPIPIGANKTATLGWDPTTIPAALYEGSVLGWARTLWFATTAILAQGKPIPATARGRAFIAPPGGPPSARATRGDP